MRARPEPEWMDDAGADAGELRRALAFIRKVNRRLGYNAATRRAVGKLGGGSVIDVCCGSADFEHGGGPYVGVDFHATTLALAREHRPGAALVRGDALRLPFGDDSFDVGVCQMALHHFDGDAAATVLRELDRVSRRGWVAADLLKRRRAAAWIWAFTLRSPPMVRHDARLSVRQAWTPRQARDLGRRFGATYRPAFGHRFLLIRRNAGGGGA